MCAGDSEFILPAQFLLGNPKWHSSMAGGQRVHPSGTGGQSRGASLDWPSRVNQRKSADTSRATVEPQAASIPTADAAASVTVRAKASMGEWTVKKNCMTSWHDPDRT